MKLLLLSIAASTLVLIIFRTMEASKANARHAITTSYLVSAAVGALVFTPSLEITSMPWFWFAAVEGMAFYLVFRLIAKTILINGLAVTSVSTKMSVVIPVGIGLLFLGESLNLYKVFGICAGIGAVYLSAGDGVQFKDAKWPLLVFLGSGIIDASFKLFQVWGVTEIQFPALIIVIFGFAFLTGLIHHFFCLEKTVGGASMISGLFLGCANFGTVYFLLKALAQPNWESSVVYAINNFGIVAMATLCAIIVFREKLAARGLAGLLLAVISIIALSFGTSR